MKNINWKKEIINIIKQIKKDEFYLSDVYNFEDDLRMKFPNNYFIKAKIRQQLQIISNQGLIEYLGDGKYRKKNVIEISTEESDRVKTEETVIIDLKKTDKVVQYRNASPEILTEKTQKINTFMEGLKKNIQDYNGPCVDLIRYVPYFYELFESLLKEKKFDKETRMLINSVVAYFVLPDDVIPEEKYGVIGYIDDLYLCVYSLEKLYQEKETIKKYWNEQQDVFELATWIKYEIENVLKDVIGKEKLEQVINYIEPGISIPVFPESQNNADIENKDGTIKENKQMGENNNVIEKKLFLYNPNLYYVRESNYYLELIDKDTDLSILILDKNNYTLMPGKINTFKEMKIENSQQKNNNIESIKPKINNNIIEREVIDYDSDLYNLKENAEFFFLISKKNDLHNKTYNKKYYFLKKKLFDDNKQGIISAKNNNIMGVFTGKKPKSIKFNNITHDVTTWREVLLNVTKQIYKEKNNFYEVIKIRGSKNMYFSKDLKDKKHGGEINVPIRIPGTQYCFEGKISANQTMKIVHELLTLFGYNPSDLEIIFKDENE